MKLHSVYDKEFSRFGKILEGDFTELISKLKTLPCPKDSTTYKPSEQSLESCEIKDVLQREVYGGMPIQIGYCNGYNVKLNALEYHKGNEINVSVEDIILILGDIRDICQAKYDTSKAQAFLLPANVAVEIYSTTLHYAPCCVNNKCYKVAIILPKGTNYDKPKDAVSPMLYGSNKWLIAFPNTNEAKNGAYVGLVGENYSVDSIEID